MRYAPLLLTTLALASCAERPPRLPTGPGSPESPTFTDAPEPSSPSASLPAPPSIAFVWAYVVDDDTRQLCIPGAWVEVVAGPAVGRRAEQETPCSVWDYGGGVLLRGLTPGVAMTLRVSAPGHVTRDTTVVPTLGWQSAVEIVLVAEPASAP